MSEFKYRVGVEDNIEHLDYWDYTASEYEQAEARFDSIALEKGEYKYISNLITGDVIMFEEK